MNKHLRPSGGLIFRVLFAATLALSVFRANAGVIITTLYSFPNDTNDGVAPQTALVQGTNGALYGTTSGWIGQPLLASPQPLDSGGFGTIFEIDTNGSASTLFAFNTGLGESPILSKYGANPAAPLTQGTDGYFYGTTAFGGTGPLAGSGTVFKISPEGELTRLYEFTNWADGVVCPDGGLIEGTDGNFYGTTRGDPVGGFGAIFKITPDGTLTTLYSFDGWTNRAAGTYPQGSLAQIGGDFYGTTSTDGQYDSGTVFKISTNGQFTSLYSFTGTNDGAWPLGGLVQGNDGLLYGTTFQGGTNNLGTVFKISTNGTLTTLHSFTGLNGDQQPWAELVLGSDGYFYGTTLGSISPFASPYGNIFRISTNGEYSNLYSFTGGAGGNSPAGGLMQARDGNFYGTTQGGGQYAAGTVFRMTIVPTPQPTLTANGMLSLTWSGETAGTYQLQYSSDLGSGQWTAISGPISVTNGTISISDAVTNTQRFYRLMPLNH